MRFFLAGIMQGSHAEALLHDQEYRTRITRLLQAHFPQADVYDPALLEYRWMLEEFRVSLFAQKLGTSMPVSGKRLDQQFAIAVYPEVRLNLRPQRLSRILHRRRIGLADIRDQFAEQQALESAAPAAAFDLRDAQDCAERIQDAVDFGDRAVDR